MKKFVVFYGLPASGKTTAALRMQRELLDAGIDSLRINQDEIRKTLNWKSWKTWNFSGPEEKSVYVIKEKQLREAFLAEIPVVINDDTNLDPARRRVLRETAGEYGYTTEFIRAATDVEECVRRDALRDETSVGRTVIEKMAAKYNYPKPPIDYSRFANVEYPAEHLMPAVICDLDGTLSLFEGKRSPYDASTCDKDDVNMPVLVVLRALASRFVQIIYLSGRNEEYRKQTETFLHRHACPPGPLHMRAKDDKRTDWIVKGELFDAHVRGKYDVLFVLDDRDQVVKLWRSIGLTCFQVAEGNF